MEEAERRLSLDRPATYQIKVPGHLDESWSDWVGGIRESSGFFGCTVRADLMGLRPAF
jgi:hypothetical protein